MEKHSSWRSFGGEMAVYDHESQVLGTTSRFGIYLPPQAQEGPCPVLWYLSGLTCTWANVMEKSGIQRAAAEHGLIVVAPDTSPRGESVADDEGYDLGQGAGFYLTATQEPWAKHYKMDQYLLEELSELVAQNFPADMTRQGITGHSMGGHGALTLHLKHPERFRSVSAFAPIGSPSQVPWGEKAFTAYLGEDREAWKAYDATELVQRKPSSATIRIDQGEADNFLAKELKPEIFAQACAASGQKLILERHPGYDHSYYFVASFVAEHVRHHAEALAAI